MASKTDALLLKIGADVSGLTKGLADANSKIGALEKQTKSAGDALQDFAKKAIAALGIKALVSSVLELGDQMTKLAAQTGESTDQVQRWNFIATQTGTTAEVIAGAVNKMQVQLVKGADGAEKQREAFEDLGIDMEAFFRLSPDQQLQTIAVEIANTGNAADQTAKAVAAFGKGGTELIPTLKAMGTDMEDLNEKFDAMGGPLSESTITALDDIGDGAATTGLAVKNFAAELLALAAPAILAAMRGVTEFFAALRAGIGGGADEMVNLDNKILDLEGSLASFKKQNPFPDQFGKEQMARMQGDLDTLRAKYQEMQAAAAAKVREQNPSMFGVMTPEMQAEELADIVAHGEAKAKVESEVWQKQSAARIAREEQLHLDLKSGKLAYENEITAIEQSGWDARMRFTQMSMGMQAATIAGELEGITAGVAQHNKVLFNINKAAGIANAIVSMHEGVAKSLSQYPMPFAAVMAAVHAAAGLARVHAIASTNYSGGGKGPAPSQGGTVATPTVPAGGASGGGGGGGGDRVMQVKGLSAAELIDGKTVRTIAAELLEFQKDGGEVVFR